ncbi:hypothetical protein Q4488_02645 [Amphritea sp. 1_MG-2023]|uniref:hypothetical protein n=1 Tax=Amphritea sp. 1_MG-2023 TaxID=3062670 RepID=UPI0026E1EE05|nr:hypothetical protein [Amphritea sp. 1_MG-2023]MDO6562272.1 hypothetical protein [Amphritea sp. 1_MG-2023]
MKIILAGFYSDVTESELRTLLSDYAEVDELKIIPGDLPEQTIAVLTIEGTNAEAHWVARRLTGLFWHQHSLRAYVSLF